MKAHRVLLVLSAASLVVIATVFTLLWQSPDSGQRASAASSCADVDHDGIVHLIDAVIVSDHFGQLVPPAPPEVDLVKDNAISIGDIIQVILVFDTTGCQTGTPQPKGAGAFGALAVDADGENTSPGDTVETKRSVPIGQTFHITVHMTTNPDPNTVGYQLRLHWDEALLDLTTRTQDENDLWLENFTGGVALQALGPADDDSGSDAFIELGAFELVPGVTTGATGPVAQFEFTCQAAGTANLTLASGGGHSAVVARPATVFSPTLTNAQINCVIGPTWTPTSTSTGSPTATNTPTPSNTPTPTPTPTGPTPTPVNVAGLWEFVISGAGTGTCNVVYTQAGSSISSDGVCLINEAPSLLFVNSTGTIDGAGVYSVTNSGTKCTSGTVDGIVALDGNSLTGDWTCDHVSFGLVSGTLTGTRPADEDGIEASIDKGAIDEFNDTSGSGTTSGKIIARNGLAVFVNDVLDPEGVRIAAIGVGGQAEVEIYCGDPVTTTTHLLDAQDHEIVTCGSTDVEVLVGPIVVEMGTILVSLPAGAEATITESSPGTFEVTNEATSSASISVGGVTVAPGNTATGLTDSDGDGLLDSVESNTGTFVDPSDTGTDPGVADTDSDGLSDGLEVLQHGSNPNLSDTDSDGCSDPFEVGFNQDLGGLRDPTSFWDFFDVWTHPSGQPTVWERNSVINIFDILGVALRFGPWTPSSKEDALAAALTPPVDDTSYHAAYDRGPVIGANNWERAPADGSINVPNDILGIAAQFGHNCT